MRTTSCTCSAVSGATAAEAPGPRQPLEHPQGIVAGQARQRRRALAPGLVELVEPEVGDIALDRLDRPPAALGLGGEGAGGGEPVVVDRLLHVQWRGRRAR